jgi:hypothetical protein
MRLTDLVTPLKPLEAMAQHKLVVASDVGGHKELIRDRETGYLFRAGDAASLVTTVLELLARHDAWPAIKDAGRAYVESERNWRTSVANYKSVYGPLVRSRCEHRMLRALCRACLGRGHGPLLQGSDARQRLAGRGHGPLLQRCDACRCFADRGGPLGIQRTPTAP